MPSFQGTTCSAAMQAVACSSIMLEISTESVGKAAHEDLRPSIECFAPCLTRSHECKAHKVGHAEAVIMDSAFEFQHPAPVVDSLKIWWLRLCCYFHSPASCSWSAQMATENSLATLQMKIDGSKMLMQQAKISLTTMSKPLQGAS